LTNIFGFVTNKNPIELKASHLSLEVDISLINISTSFIPMYYIMGLVSEDDMEHARCLESFDSIYCLLSPSCNFLPSIGKSF
jgi:hypothetical protein